jgi:hypothetical protein
VNMPGFAQATGTVTFRPSGIVIGGPAGRGNPFTVATGSTPTTLTVEAAMLDVLRNFVELQQVASNLGVPAVSVAVTSSDTSAGTISASPVTIPAGSTGTTTTFVVGQQGSTTITVGVPSGFSIPTAYGSVDATVAVAGIAVTDGVSIGKNLQIPATFTLGSFASPGLVVTITSSNSNLLRISTSPTAAGSSFVKITMAGGTFQGSYYLQALASSGTVQYTATAPGFSPRTGTITLTPSGVKLGDGIRPTDTVVGSPITVSLAQLDSGGNFVEIQQLAGGQSPVSINLSTTIFGATIASPVTIAAGASNTTAALTGSGFGQVTASTPPGFTASNFQTVTLFF